MPWRGIALARQGRRERLRIGNQEREVSGPIDRRLEQSAPIVTGPIARHVAVASSHRAATNVVPVAMPNALLTRSVAPAVKVVA